MRVALMLAGMLGLVAGSQGAAAKLSVGDRAPKLQVSKWVQGDPVNEFSKDNVYIVEFWATWCGPCRESIPHLNEVYKKYKDRGLVVIGQDVWEEDDSDVMTYRVALDDKKGSEKGKMADTWMEAAGQNGIPTAFVVTKTGEIAWIGHPMSLKEKLLDDVLAGTFDVKKAAADYAQKKEQEEKYETAFQEFQKAAKGKEWDKAESFLQQMEKSTDEDGRTEVEMVRLKMNLMKGDTVTAEAVAKRLGEKQPENAAFHGAIAWQLATIEGASKSLLEVAEKEANRANEIAKGKDADVLDTLARVQFVKGDKEAGVATEQKAVEAAEDAKAKANYKKTLDSYKSGKIPEA